MKISTQYIAYRPKSIDFTRFLSILNFLNSLFKTNLSPLNHSKSQKTSKKTTKISRFEKSLLGFFGLMVYLKFFQLNKTLSDLNLTLELETNLLNPSLLRYRP